MQLPIVLQLMTLAGSEDDLLSAALYGLSYTFMARVSSELLRVFLPGDGIESGSNPVLVFTDNAVDLRLSRRKNEPHGATVSRKCSCGRGRQVCVVHFIALFMKLLPPGTQPFVHLTAKKITSELRRRLTLLGITDAENYSLHGFRRGGAQDLA